MGAALENALTPKCFFSFRGRNWGCEDESGWRTADDALEGSEVSVPVGTGWLRHSCSYTQETGFCSQYAFGQVASVAHGDWE